MKHYRALLSIPVEARSDDDAVRAADEHAASLLHPGGGAAVGHVEFVGEVAEGQMEVTRVITADPLFLRQLPPDWKP